MLGCFPDPYPDELLYSVYSRFKDRMRYTDSAVNRELFDDTNSSTKGIDLPGKLDKLVNKLPPGSHYGIDRLIDNHTLLPFYSPFLGLRHYQHFRYKMSSSKEKPFRRNLGCLATDGIRLLRYLRFCPLCYVEDKKRFGESYWHRLHQVPCVLVCPIHYVFLRSSKRPRHYQYRWWKLISAEQAIEESDKSIHYLNVLDFHQQTFLSIANDVAWLLNQPEFTLGPSLLSKHYYSALQKKNRKFKSAKPNSTDVVFHEELENALTARYSSDFFDFFESGILRQKKNFGLTNLIFYRDKTRQYHPFRHFLLIYFLGYTVKQFLTSASKV